MRIYADFNSIKECSFRSFESCLSLTGYGTLASLNFYKIKLEMGQIFDFFDPDGLLVKGEVFINEEDLSENNSGWFAAFNKKDIVDIDPIEHDLSILLCFKCRENIVPYLEVSGRNYNEQCPHCGTSVMYALQKPPIKGVEGN